MIKLKSLLLKEGSFRGEWWFQEDGFAQFADGDVGDMNHETYVIERLRREILGELDIDFDEEYIDDLGNYKDAIFEKIRDELNAAELGDWNDELYMKVLSSYFKRTNAELLIKMKYAWGSGDAREYALIHWGWQRVKGNIIQTQTLTSKDLTNIVRGLNDAYGDELEDTDETNVSNDNPMGEPTFNIEVMSTRSWYSGIPISVLDKKDPTALNGYRARYE